MKPEEIQDEEWTLEKTLTLSLEKARELWKRLPAPDLHEMDGEFDGLIPMDGSWSPTQTEEGRKEQIKLMYSEDSPTGYWLGKSFKPMSVEKGEGYCRWRRPGGKVDRYMRFGWAIGPSDFDGEPAINMYYSHYQPYGDNGIVEEVRKLADGIYLGVASIPDPDGNWGPIAPFLLAGPVHEWVGVDDPKKELKEEK